MNDSEKAQSNFLKNIYDNATLEREAAEKVYEMTQKVLITEREEDIVKYAEEKLFSKDRSYTNLDVLFDLNKGGLTYCIGDRVKIHLKKDIWTNIALGMSLFAHEILHSLRPHEENKGVITYMEEGAARWLENNYLRDKTDLYVPFHHIDEPENIDEINNNRYWIAGKIVLNALREKPDFFKALLNGNSKKMSAINEVDFDGLGFDKILIEALLHDFYKPMSAELMDYINSLSD